MKNTIILLTILLIFSCKSSAPCNTFAPIEMELDSNVFEGTGSGSISQISIKDDNIIEIKDNEEIFEIQFSDSIPLELLGVAENSSNYIFYSRPRPDGPVEYLILEDSVGMKSYWGDALRSGTIRGLDIVLNPVNGSDTSVEIVSDNKKYEMSAGQERIIKMKGITYRALLLNIHIGDPQFDQPPLTIDLLLIRQ